VHNTQTAAGVQLFVLGTATLICKVQPR